LAGAGHDPPESTGDAAHWQRQRRTPGAFGCSTVAETGGRTLIDDPELEHRVNTVEMVMGIAGASPV